MDDDALSRIRMQAGGGELGTTKRSGQRKGKGVGGQRGVRQQREGDEWIN